MIPKKGAYSMKVIGLTGTSGSGKSYACEIFAMYKIKSVDTDKVVHALYKKDEECKNELRQEFGDGIFNEKGSVCRTRLRKIVFSDKEKLEKLNKIVHKYVIKKCNEKIENALEKGEKAIIIDAPLLYEAGMDKSCDFVISLTADVDVRRERLAKRDHLSAQEIEKRIKNQHTDGFFAQKADYVIINNGEEIKPQIEKILELEELL